ncbi:serine protease [Kitasatospora sp. NBC_00315]|uniref:trypsin-like serine peptidase n=1 Tax=Kitasatospora sp. NBC_00315 TaxID=2975963 RepID=UPI00324C0EEC
MAHHRRTPRRRRILRPAVLTTCAALAVVAVLTGAHALTARNPAAPSSSADLVAGAGADPALTASADPAGAADPPSASPASSPASSDSPTATARAAASPSASVRLGVTQDAPADAESAKVGALFSGAVSTGKHFCTASVVHSPTRNLLLTAAHCLSSSGNTTFVPGYREGSAPYGTWKVTGVHTTTGWDQQKDPDEDFAILEVAPSGGREIEDVVGSHPLGTDETFTAEVRLFGYASSDDTPIVCVNSTGRQDTYQRVIDCPAFPGGTSGGPWVSTTTGAVIGLIGGYQEGGNSPDVSYSSYFDHTIASLYATAVAEAS